MKNACSLYVHIPYCASKCYYCDFFSRPFKSVPDDYIDCLIKEASFYSDLYHLDLWKTLYIGGGTPSLLSPEQIQKLLTGIAAAAGGKFSDTEELTIEMNPESVSKEKLLSAQLCGINRLSLGIQTLTDQALKAVGRHCTSDSVFRCLELVKKYWKGKVSLDVIAGLPCQTDEEFEESLKQIISFGSNHISLYTLTIEENTPLCRMIDEKKINWDPDFADKQWLTGRDLLIKNGYSHYEVSNFAREGFQSIHNMTYWQQGNYIGIGSGASGSIYNREGFRWTNTCNTDAYIDFWKKSSGHIHEDSIPRNIERLSLETMEFEFLMMGLRTLKGLDKEIYKKRYSDLFWQGDLKKRLEGSSVWRDFYKQGKARNFALTEDGLLFLNKLLLDLD